MQRKLKNEKKAKGDAGKFRGWLTDRRNDGTREMGEITENEIADALKQKNVWGRRVSMVRSEIM
jgi:hypothetical protein